MKVLVVFIVPSLLRWKSVSSPSSLLINYHFRNSVTNSSNSSATTSNPIDVWISTSVASDWNGNEMREARGMRYKDKAACCQAKQGIANKGVTCSQFEYCWKKTDGNSFVKMILKVSYQYHTIWARILSIFIQCNNFWLPFWKVDLHPNSRKIPAIWWHDCDHDPCTLTRVHT